MAEATGARGRGWPAQRLMAALLCALAMAGTAAARDLQPLQVGGARILLVIAQGSDFALDDAALRGWVARSAQVVADYYGRFPVPEVRIQLLAQPGGGTRGGNMRGGPRPHINVRLGEQATEADLRRDWIMVHEMVHTAFPDVHDRHHWIEEGLAVYVESMARLHAGDLSDETVWGEFAARMHQGLPRSGDRGLDRTPSWGRTYWGGAIYCFLADMRIRRQTHNRYSLREALRAVLAAGHDARGSAPLAEVLAIGDRATGTGVLVDLYEQMRETPVMVDLQAIWDRLGVRVGPRGVRFDPTAPDAWLRAAMSRAALGGSAG